MGVSTEGFTEEKTSEKDVSKDVAEDAKISKDEKKFTKMIHKLKKNNVSILLPFECLDRKHQIYLFFQILASICSGFCFPIFNVFFGKTMKGIIEKTDINEYIVIFLFVGLAQFCLSFVAGFFSDLVTQNIVDNLRLRYLKAVFHFDGEFFDKYSGAKLKSDLEFYLSNIKAGVGIKFVLSFTYLTNFFILYIWGLSKSYRLVLCISLVFPFMVLVSKLCRTYSLRYQLKSQIYNNNSLSVAEEAFVGIKTVVSYGGENFILKKFALSEKLYSKFTLKTNFFHSLNLGAMKLFTIGSYSLGFWYGTKIIVEEFWNSVATQNPSSFDGATVISVLIGVFVSMYMLNLALPGFHEYLNAVNATYQLFEIINYVPIVSNEETKGKTLESVKKIKFKNVKFHYSKRSNVDIFQGLNFELEEGKVYAFVGESGCGKSTILKLIERLYEPTEGEILINGKNNLKSLNLKWWRSQIGIVSQDPHLFSSSIATNIKYSLISKYELDAMREGRVIDNYKKEDVDINSIQNDDNTTAENVDEDANKNIYKHEGKTTKEKENVKKQRKEEKAGKRVNLGFVSNAEVRSIGKKVYIHNFVNTLPKQYDTLIGATASSLSGGQKQRISIGRAIIREPQILILDEATSSLDNKSEHMVQKTINKLQGNESRITIIVAHRLNTIHHADNIFVLSNKHKSGSTNTGSYIAEQGTHEQLMQIKNGLYYTMVKNQKVTDETEHNKHNVLSRVDTVESGSMMYNSFDGSSTGYEQVRSGMSEFSQDKNKTTCNKCLLFSFMNKCKSRFSRNKKYSYIYKQILQNKWQAAVALFFTLLTSIIYPLFGLIFAKYVEALFQIEDAEENSKKYSIGMVYISIGMGIGECFQQYFKCVVGENVESVTKYKLFENVLHQEISFFEEKKQSPGYLLSYINRDIHLLKIGFINNIGIIIQFVGLFLTSGVLAFYFCPLVALIMTFVYFVFVRLISKRNIFQQKKVGNSSEADSGMTHFHFTSDDDMEKDADFLIQEAFLNIDVIISYGLESYYIHLISNSLQNSYREHKKKLIFQSIVWGLSQSIQLFSNAFVYYLGSILTRDYNIEVENFLKSVFVFLFTGSYAGITMADKGNSTEALETFDVYYPLMIRKSQIDSRDEGGIKIDKNNALGRIEIKDVNFRYPSRPSVSVYNNLTFTCEEKQTTAIVGETGCGKSTIMGLLLKYYELRDEHVMLKNADSIKKDATNMKKKYKEESVETNNSASHTLKKNDTYSICRNNGEILIDGININDYNLRDLRKLFSIVTQEPMLFNMSIYENITFGIEEATIEDVKRASKIAAIYDFIESLPEKYDTNVGPFGKNLSGGQKQRIALARALLKDPKILLLDEATSSLDSNSEKLIEEAFDKIKSSKDKTIITIAHRISSIMKSDKIVVLNNPDNKGSSVQAQGKHYELMQIKDGIYKKYVNLTM